MSPRAQTNSLPRSKRPAPSSAEGLGCTPRCLLRPQIQSTTLPPSPPDLFTPAFLKGASSVWPEMQPAPKSCQHSEQLLGPENMRRGILCVTDGFQKWPLPTHCGHIEANFQGTVAVTLWRAGHRDGRTGWAHRRLGQQVPACSNSRVF